jgi:uncharacterized protein YdiU (UPF0061 family)
LALLERRELDYPSTLRHLARFQPALLKPENSTDLQKLLDEIDMTSQCSKLEETNATRDEWKQWLETFAKRIEDDRQAWLNDNVSGDKWLQERREEMEAANPRFILRQWVLEEVIAKVEKDPISGRRVLAKILEVRFD